jgi:hypothetical protein
MSYSRLSYKNLQQITHTQDPFRGTMNFPMYKDRRQPYSCFQLVEVGNDIEYHVAYHRTSEEIEISEERYNLLKDVRGKSVHKKDREWQSYDFFEYKRIPNTIAIVRSDNTVEFVKNHYWQGERVKLSQWMGYYANHSDSYRFGGDVMTRNIVNGGQATFPIFKGLRINVETCQPHESLDIKVFRRTIDRKKSKVLMEKYNKGLIVADAMLKCLDTDTMMVSVKELLEEYKKKDDNGYAYVSTDTMMQIGDNLLDSGSEFEASLMYAMGLKLDGFSVYSIEAYKGVNRYNRVCEPKNLVSRVKACIAKKAYSLHKPFIEEEVPFLGTKGSEWGLRVVVNGVEVRS